MNIAFYVGVDIDLSGVEEFFLQHSDVRGRDPAAGNIRNCEGVSRRRWVRNRTFDLYGSEGVGVGETCQQREHEESGQDKSR